MRPSRRLSALAVSLALAAAPATAQTPPMEVPGKPDPARVKAGSYKVDPDHTQILFAVNHLGFNVYYGTFGRATGSLALDPANLAAAKVDITIPIKELVTTSGELTKHLMAADFFDVAKFPTARFQSTKVSVTGTKALITGNLTLHGVTRPVFLDARFVGAGNLPVPPRALNVGFEAQTTLRRSDFGLGYGVPMVTDRVVLKITAAFEKVG